MLKSWAQLNGLVIGIPQGNDVSSFLANVYLDEVEKAMIESGFIYFRFTDDIRIFVKNKSDAEKAIIKLTSYLRPLNLHLNSSKTIVIKKEKFEKEQDNFNGEMTAIEYDIDTVIFLLNSQENIRVIMEMEDRLKKIFNYSLKRNQFNPRNFKFCVNRFKKIKSKYPLDKILKIELWEYSTIKEICDYIYTMNYQNIKRVKMKIINIYNLVNYDYLKILLIRTLVFFKKDEVCLNLETKNDFNSDNFMVKGYITIYIFKFLNEVRQNEIIKNIQENHIHNKDFYKICGNWFKFYYQFN